MPISVGQPEALTDEDFVSDERGSSKLRLPLAEENVHDLKTGNDINPPLASRNFGLGEDRRTEDLAEGGELLFRQFPDRLPDFGKFLLRQVFAELRLQFGRRLDEVSD